ncbi:hypothetical protein, partial [Actinomadura sediminis]
MMTTPALPPAPGPASLLPAACAAVLAVAAPLLSGGGTGPLQRALAGLLAAAAYAAAGAAWR